MTGDARIPPTAAADAAGKAKIGPGERPECADALEPDLHPETPPREPAHQGGPPDEAYWQRLFDRATD